MEWTVAHSAICVDEMSAVCAYATCCISRPIMAMRLSRSYNISGVGRRAEHRLYGGGLSDGEKQIERIWDLGGANGGRIRINW
jgi:hypothetical protein